MTYYHSAKAAKSKVKRSRRPRLPNAINANKFTLGLKALLAKRLAEEDNQAPPRVYGYGLARVRCTRTFRQITSDKRLHVVDVIAGDEIDGVLAFLVDDAVVFPGEFPGQFNSGDVIISGRFRNNGTRMRLHEGAPGQTADGNLVDQTAVTSSFVGTGIAYVYSRFTFIEGRFDGDPEVSVLARLRKALDPRTAAYGWTFNPYVQLYDILTKSRDIGGVGLSESLIYAQDFIDAANWAEATLSRPGITKTALFTTDTNTASANHLFEFNQEVAPFNYGDVVQLVAASGQAMPPNFSPGVDYHVIPVRHRVGDFQVPAVALASTLADALAGNFIAAGFRSKDVNVKKVGEVRLMSGFTYLSTDDPLDVAFRILESCGANFYLRDGQIGITRTVWPASVESVTEDEIIGGIAMTNRLPAEERATELTGTYTSLLNLFRAADYPTVDGGGVYEDLDGERIKRRLDLPFVGKAGVAQRLATIALRRLRQERTVAFDGSLALFKLQPGSIFDLTKASLGLDSATTWQVRDHTLFVSVEDDKPFIGVDIGARQLEESTFDLEASDETFVDSLAIPGLDDPFEVETPGQPTIVESLYTTTNGAGVRARATITWTAPPDNFVAGYLVSYKLQSESEYRSLPQTPDTTIKIDDIAPGDYDFRVIAVNARGLQSDPSDKQQTILALSAPPGTPTNLIGGVVGSGSVILTWDLTADLDVLVGGTVEIRHHSDPAGSLGGDSVLLATQAGSSALAQLPFKRGTYYIRFIDQANVASDFAEFSFDSRRPVPFGQTLSSGAFVANNSTEDQITIQEDSSFPSTDPNNTLVVDGVNNWLELPPAENWDDITNLDDVTNIDEVGASGATQQTGVYYYSSPIYLAAVTRMLIETVAETAIVDESTSLDAIENFDAIEDLDAVGANASQPGAATSYHECRTTRDDPTGSPTWSDWRRIDTDVLNHRGVEFRYVVERDANIPTINLRTTQLRVIARELPVDF